MDADVERSRIEELKKSAAKSNLTVHELLQRYQKGERDFSGVVITNQDFSGLDLRGVRITEANLSFCRFSGTNLESADLSGTDFTWGDFTNANLRKAKLQRAVFRWAFFSSTFLDDADLSRADLGWAKIENTNLSVANLSEANIGWAALNRVTVNSSQLPRDVLSTLKLTEVSSEKGAVTEHSSRKDTYHSVGKAGYGAMSGTITLTGQIEYGAQASKYKQKHAYEKKSDELSKYR